MDGEAAVTAEGENQPQPDAPLPDGDAAPADGAPAGGLQIGEDGQPVPQEEAKVEELIPEEILRNMENVWAVFDQQKTHSVEIQHLRTIMRALDFDFQPEELEIV